MAFTESTVEEAALSWLAGLGYEVLYGPEIAAGEPGAERSDQNYRDVVLERRLHQALVHLNPDLPHEALEDAYRKVTRTDAPSLVERNRAVHRILVNGVTVEFRRKDGSIAGAQARVVDYDTPANNDWLAVNQFTVSEGQHIRRPDVVLFINGLPLAVIELKNPADENATVWSAFQQLQTYQAQIPALFATNAALVASDGVKARIGTLGADKEWFKPWRTIAGIEDAPSQMPELQVMLEGVFEPRRFLDLLRQPPIQAADRADLRAKLAVASGGVVFTTIQKFLPEEKGDRYPVLSDRRNIVVIADEAHRSQYDFIDGFARHMRDALPFASFVGFTGTPIEKTDANTRAVFGDYISVYDIQRAVADGATVPIYYESRLAKLELKESERPKIDPDFEEATEGEEVERKERLKSRWAQFEAVVGSENRIRLVAQDLVEHFEKRLAAMDGKAMVVVMTGAASDPLGWQPHIRNKQRREALAACFRDSKDPFQIVIMRDMWLTGFDAPSLHTMCLDKPMRGHGLMQAIARVNRVFKDKPGGLVVDYLGLAKEMRAAGARGEQLGLSEDELAFYDALETNDSAVRVLGDETLKTISRELVETLRQNVTIDWTIRENVRAQLRVYVKRILRKYGYPPDKQEKLRRQCWSKRKFCPRSGPAPNNSMQPAARCALADATRWTQSTRNKATKQHDNS